MQRIFKMTFPADVFSVSDTPSQLRKKIYALEAFCSNTAMDVNLTKVVIFRNAGHFQSYKNVHTVVKILMLFHSIDILT